MLPWTPGSGRLPTTSRRTGARWTLPSWDKFYNSVYFQVGIDMSLRKDSFERPLAFSKLEEAKHMDMETTR